jgi:hypothetical protein
LKAREKGWFWKGLLDLLMFLARGICGILVENRQLASLTGNIGSRMEVVHTPGSSPSVR